MDTERGQPTIVVVDDEAPIVEVVCDVLSDADITAVGCTHGRDAYPCILEHHPQAVILDVQMPDVDGITLFQQLRADPSTSELPVIFFTANSHMLKQRLPDYRDQGATLLPKPFDLDRLLTEVERALTP
jgi:CheY-like chemotaxis protein